MQPVLLWFRRNLRLSDNAALIAAAESGQPIIPVYIVDEQDTGGASGWWLHHSLVSLDRDLQNLGSSLVIRSGSPDTILSNLLKETGATAIYYTRRYEPVSRQQELALAATLPDAIDVRASDDSLMQNPEAIKTRGGTPYRVFTPFMMAARELGEPPVPRPLPAALNFVRRLPQSQQFSEVDLLFSAKERKENLGAHWIPGEASGLNLIDALESALRGYDEHRDRPDIDATSRLSPYLHFGEVSIRQVWLAARQLELELKSEVGSSSFLRQLYWREFSTYLLFHFPALPEKPLRSEFEGFPWTENKAQLIAWQQGMTGYPIVDAGMRQLLQTGWMHNRVRMIAASFLVKDLLIPWQTGAAWFLDNLVDADLANNSASWQWVAGCGSDAAPYFRVFNPILQGTKFDPHGEYVCRWVPDLTEQASSAYPQPIVDHSLARQRALAAYQTIKGMRTSKLAP
ncbi:MAG: cryptochrome/photolyase family protein [Gammaproteobacteria bacterium]